AACRAQSMAVVAYSPIARGNAKNDAVLARVGQAHGKTAAQVCLRWLTQQQIAVIPRTSRVERLLENFSIFDFELSAAEMAEIGALTREVAIEIADNGLPTTFVPGRNLVFFAFAGALAYRRGAKHLVAGMCETDFSGYPDCRDDTLKAMQLALNLGMDTRFVVHTPLMWIDKAATFALAHELGGDSLIDLLVDEAHGCYLVDRSHPPAS